MVSDNDTLFIVSKQKTYISLWAMDTRNFWKYSSLILTLILDLRAHKKNNVSEPAPSLSLVLYGKRFIPIELKAYLALRKLHP